MTDKQIIETLKNLKKHCEHHCSMFCHHCCFFIEDENLEIKRCQIKWFVGNLTREPMLWDMEKLERIIND